ncbi:MAG: amidase, partial [bacterium]
QLAEARRHIEILKAARETLKTLQTRRALLAARRELLEHARRALREAGAIILGKANLSEWANFRSTRSSSGWSGRGGQARNPYALDRNPCGSSSGSGITVAANLCTVAIGTETNGSVVCPSTANGIVGIKPTVGLVSRSGIIPIAHSQDTAGPMARTVRDAAILLGALTGTDSRDEATKQNEGKVHRDYTQFLDPQGMKGARIGVARNYFGFHEMVDKLMEGAIAAMKALGATVVDPANIETRGKYGDSGFDVLLYEFKTDLNKYLATLSSNVAVHSLEELIAFNAANKDKEMPYFGQEILEMAQEKGDLASPEYKEALAKIHRLSRDEGIDATLNTQQLDAIIAPTGGPAWLTDWVNGDHYVGGSSSPAARSGYPNITVPAGFVHGLPVGISFFSRAYNESLLIKLAYAFEQATQHRKPPQFLPHVQIG